MLRMLSIWRGEIRSRWRPLAAILRDVAAETDLPPETILGRRRTGEIVAARHALYARGLAAGHSQCAVARFARRDPTTVNAFARRTRAAAPELRP